jgi:hypothetical protein
MFSAKRIKINWMSNEETGEKQQIVNGYLV